eukprot:gene1508-2905_t
MGNASSADGLTPNSRTFYENAKTKVMVSVLLAAYAVVLLGFCAQAGGESAAAQTNYKAPNGNNYDKHNYSQTASISGYGFATFCFILSSVIMIYGAFYISPFACGSSIEKATLKSPKETETV